MKGFEEISEDVRAFIGRTLEIPAESIASTSAINELTEDSIKLFELLLAFEREYKIETAYDDIIKMHTVGDIIHFVERVKYT